MILHIINFHLSSFEIHHEKRTAGSCIFSLLPLLFVESKETRHIGIKIFKWSFTHTISSPDDASLSFLVVTNAIVNNRNFPIEFRYAHKIKRDQTCQQSTVI